MDKNITYSIYKITCIDNNKVYIGQTIRPVKQRFLRHLDDAIKQRIDTKFARAIRKHGRDKFVVEVIDTSATSQEELTELEYEYICKYDSVEKGYNSTNDKHKCGGNTYQYIDTTEVKKKLHDIRMGGNNPMAKKIKIIDLLEKIEIIMNSMADAMRYLNLNNHQHISRRCLNKLKSPLNNRYWFEYA